MLSVYYDYQIMLAQRYGGISRYIYELASRLPALGADVSLRCINNHNYYFADRFGVNDMPKHCRILRLALSYYVNKAAAALDVRRRHYDIVHPTYYYASKPAHGKFIVTVHDMTHEKYSGIYPVSQRVIAAKKRIIPQADRIITVSENTKKDLLLFFPDVDPAKISVIYHGASMIPADGKFQQMDGRDYVLFVGDRRMYKNFPRFVQAITAVMSTHKDLHVFCAGGGAFTPQEVALFGEYASRFWQGGLSDEELARAYGNALCFVFPSEYEGFGIPILEAFACGCPVVCSRASSFPEVAGDAAEYFDSLDAEDMADKVQRVIDDESLRGVLADRGRERLKLYDWDKTARGTLECYKEALNND